VVTGSGGLVGAETARHFADQGLDVVGIDNDLRSTFFGPEASTAWQVAALKHAVTRLFERLGRDLAVVVHCAAQPSHDWAARDPVTDFTVNANGTLTLLEATRRHAPDAVFIFASTNKVYGDHANRLPLVELDTRFEVASEHPWAAHGIPEEMSVDGCLHSLFGSSKLAADVLVQEYGRYFGMKTACFRGGCLTGPGHSGAQLHGFLAYLVKCAMTGTPYTVFGYKGKQVRDNIHARDLVRAFWAFFQRPRSGEVFNMGGGRHANCSMTEAIAMAEALTGRPMTWSYQDANRVGDHIWWISDTRRFRTLYPEWSYQYDIQGIMQDIHQGLSERVGPGRP